MPHSLKMLRSHFHMRSEKQLSSGFPNVTLWPLQLLEINEKYVGILLPKQGSFILCSHGLEAQNMQYFVLKD